MSIKYGTAASLGAGGLNVGSNDVTNESTVPGATVTNALDFMVNYASEIVLMGAIDASTNPNYPSGNQGEAWKISVDGYIGGGPGVGLQVHVNDTIFCLVNGSPSGTQAAVGANWFLIKSPGTTVSGPTVAVDSDIALFDGVSGRIIKDGGKSIVTTVGSTDATVPTSLAVKTANDEQNKRISNALSTGILNGGILTLDSPTTFNLSAGSGIIVNNYLDPLNATTTIVSWPNYSGVLDLHIGDDVNTYILIQSNGSIFQQTAYPTPENRRDMISIGWTDHANLSSIDIVYTEPVFSPDTGEQMKDFFDAFGSFNVDGNDYTSTSLLTIARSIGDTFEGGSNYYLDKNNPNIVTTDIENPCSLHYYYQTSPGVWNNALANVMSINPNQYDSGSGLVSVTSGNWTIQTLFFYAPTLSNDVQYGQAQFSTLADAQAAINDSISINPYNSFDTFRAWLIVKQGATDLTNPAQAKFIPAGKLGLVSEAAGGTVSAASLLTVENAGLAGTGLFWQKVGTEFQFYNIEQGSNIAVSLNNTNKTVQIAATGLASNIMELPLKIDGGGYPIVSGMVTPFEAIRWNASSITGWKIRLTDASGVDVTDSCATEVWASTSYSGVLSKISGNTAPFVTTGFANAGTDMTGWTTTLTRGGWITLKVTSAPTTATCLSFQLDLVTA